MLANAHRGDWSVSRENTLAAFAAAEQAGADMIELDVRLAADGGVAVLHDRTLERVWGMSRAIAELTLDELREIGVPGLRETLAATELPVMVDYVDFDVAEPALEEVRRAGAVERALFAGGNLEGHRRLRELEPAARIALTWTTRTPPSDELLDELEPEYFNPAWELLQPALVEAMHERGLRVSAWTVDEPATMAAMLDLGVDLLTTNRVAELVALLADRGAARC
ncbi:MAG TPA: glycerophosphodiester phosphodiesterase [Gaiellaceae bacterium]